MIYEDAIPITPSLVNYLISNNAAPEDGPDPSMRTLESLEPKHVVPFLKEHLDWRITDVSSSLKNAEEDLISSGLEITVSDRLYDLPTNEKPLGEYYPSSIHQEITEGKLGGYGYVAT